MGRKKKVWWSNLRFFAFCLMKWQSWLAMNFISIKPKLNNVSLLHGQPPTPVVTLTSCFIGRNLDSWTTMLTDHVHEYWLYFMSFPYSCCGYWSIHGSCETPSRPRRSCQKLRYDWRKSMFPSKVVKKICTCSFSATKKFYPYTVLFKSEWTVRCSWFLRSCANRESRTSYWESSQGLSLKRQKTKDSPMTDFSITF